MKAYAIALVVVAGSTSYGQSPESKPAIATQEEYSDAMKAISAQNTSLRKALQTPSEADAMSAATELEATFKSVMTYWENRKVEDATTQASKAVSAVQDISKSLQKNDIQGATTASQVLAGTCMACHATHRDRLTDGFYKIK